MCDQSSCNPASIEPKKQDRRRLNAWRHGLTGTVQFHSDVERAIYDLHCKGIHNSLAPGNEFETDLVQQIADDRWRLKRAFGIEQAIFAADGMNVDMLHEHEQIDIALMYGRTWLKEGKNIGLLSLYERRIQNNMERNLKILMQSQSARQEALERAAEHALLLEALARKKGQLFNIEKDFPRDSVLPQFDFSGAEIARAAAYKTLLTEMKTPPRKAA
jgi:hypothetical protein